MDRLGFYPLTIILTYLGERDGTCLLVTKRYYAKSLLPMFRWPAGKDGYQRYRYQVSPVQGPVILLQRLNTRRLHKRRSKRGKGKDDNSNNHDDDAVIIITTRGLSTVQIANREWTQQQHHKCYSSSSLELFPHPASLELLRFLDQIPTKKKKDEVDDIMAHKLKDSGIVLLLSYPRSGNTLLRTLLERTTGIVTGSDTRPDRTLSKALAETHNLVGEGVTQQSKTCFVKTHWPERSGCRILTAPRSAILLIRNPYDAIDSYWNLNVTNTHTETVTDAIYHQYQDQFQAMAKNEIHIWCQYHRYWLDRHEQDDFPLLLVRFEDLIQRPDIQLTRILEFVFNNNNNNNSNNNSNETSLDSYWQQRIRHATTSTKTSSLGSYQPRTETHGVSSIGKSLQKGRYVPDLLDYFHQVAAASKDDDDDNLLKRFGYDIHHQNFPQNFVEGKEPKMMASSTKSSSYPWAAPRPVIRVNSGNPVRPVDCPFGRAMRTWRLEHTNNDTEPFPTVPRAINTTKIISNSSS
jgi:Sulfotransferase domain